ncbi:acyl-CoA dehydrogenase family protein [Jongsikchunia kroppenstedtii]|uniref:acyl-CoA dehydrogenase family protein n=1 Tax=Jongsikchunia kroppenstedtii TaxID=1121721 RepID=UPI000381C465|nr:acyl-CoA dehydrogenase family protein [Jongsikchunia kroppenstedtii]
MRIAYTDEQQALRQELRAYFEKLMTPERREAMASDSGEYGEGNTYREIVRDLGRDGWLALGWPEQYGGQARPMMDQLIFTDEAAIAGVPVPFLTINSVAPTIMHFGTEEQKQKFLPGIAAGEIHFSIGYSEPGAGTDLASLRTSAVPDGDDFVINGQKMWTSLIKYADYIWLAVRTDPEAKKHKGISMLIVPTSSEGFSYTEVHTMSGVDTSATYYQDVRVPSSALVGGLNGGWPLVTNQLNNERVALCSAAPIQTALRETIEWAQNTKDARGQRVIDAEWVQLNLAKVHAKVEFLKLINWKIASEAAGSSPTPADASATKVFGTEFATEAYRLLMEVVGPTATLRRGAPGSHLAGRLERFHRSSLILTFGGGTNEVQRDIIAMMALGQPPAAR